MSKRYHQDTGFKADGTRCTRMLSRKGLRTSEVGMTKDRWNGKIRVAAPRVTIREYFGTELLRTVQRYLVNCQEIALQSVPVREIKERAQKGILRVAGRGRGWDA